jgi:protein PhnA
MNWNKNNNDSNDEESSTDESPIVRDSNGTILSVGDTVLIIKDLKVKGGGTLKKGTKIKNIRLTDDDEGVLGNSDTMKGLSIRPEYVKKA